MAPAGSSQRPVLKICYGNSVPEGRPGCEGGVGSRFVMRFDPTREYGRLKEGVVSGLKKVSCLRGDLGVRGGVEERLCRSTCGCELARGLVLLV